MISERPWIPLYKTSSVTQNASLTPTARSTTWSNLSLGTTRIASTYFLSFSIPASAWAILFLPSQVNGFVTKAIVKMPKSLATCATIGAAPVPVPPPIPAVMNTISAPSRAFVISSLTSIAAFSPVDGSPPEPKPFVVAVPSCNLFGTLL